MRMILSIFVVATVLTADGRVHSVESLAEGDRTSERTNICRPYIEPVAAVSLGESALFHWTCRGGKESGEGYYIVFIRPVGTYVLLRVPRNRNSFEFTPDTEGQWRCIVIHTDPDRTQPDLESEPLYFEVLKSTKP